MLIMVVLHWDGISILIVVFLNYTIIFPPDIRRSPWARRCVHLSLVLIQPVPCRSPTEGTNIDPAVWWQDRPDVPIQLSGLQPHKFQRQSMCAVALLQGLFLKFVVFNIPTLSAHNRNFFSFMKSNTLTLLLLYKIQHSHTSSPLWNPTRSHFFSFMKSNTLTLLLLCKIQHAHTSSS